MCGLAGIINKHNNFYSSEEKLAKMLNKINHRGPDDLGIHSFSHSSLGMTRLSIIDLESGSQPIHSNDESIVLFCNGEIYNYLKLKSQYCKDYKFKSSSDVEVIIPLYQKFGMDSFKMLDGMFSISLIDKRKEEIVISRDRFGIKPLYYFFDDQSFLFSSEIKSILAIKPDLKINKNVFKDYLLRGFSLYSKSCWDEINILKPGSIISVPINNYSKFEIKKYYKKSKEKEFFDRQEAVLKLREAVINSVESQLMSDVPLGIFLSGGLDSSILTGIISQILDKKVPTYSIDFNKKGYSEQNKFSYVSHKFGVENQIININSDIIESINDLVLACDEPFGDPAALATLRLCEISSKTIKVALSGDGSDEYMYGYGHNKISINKKHNWFKRTLKKILENIPIMSPIQLSLLYRTTQNKGYPILSIYEIISDKIFLDYSKQDFLSRFNKIEKYDRDSYLPNDILYKTDRTSMFTSLETRVPFLGNEVVEVAEKIPKTFQMRNGINKSVLADSFSDILDENIINQNKHGFTLPLKFWITRKFSKKQLVDELMNSDLKGIIDFKFINKLINQTYTSSSDHSRFIYRLLVASQWIKAYRPSL